MDGSIQYDRFRAPWIIEGVSYNHAIIMRPTNGQIIPVLVPVEHVPINQFDIDLEEADPGHHTPAWTSRILAEARVHLDNAEAKLNAFYKIARSRCHPDDRRDSVRWCQEKYSDVYVDIRRILSILTRPQGVEFDIRTLHRYRTVGYRVLHQPDNGDWGPYYYGQNQGQGQAFQPVQGLNSDGEDDGEE